MTRGSAEWYLDWLTHHFERLHNVTAQKNSDYSTGGDVTRCAFDNFEHLEKLSNGRLSTQDGFLFRMSDKWSRLINLLTKDGEPEVEDESVEDTIDDLTLYLCLFRAWRIAKNSSAKFVGPSLEEALGTKNKRRRAPHQN